MRFSAAHFIPYHAKCRRLHGHDYAIDIKIFGELKNGMITDFVTVKKEMRELLEQIDHKLILPSKGKNLEYELKETNYIIEYEGKKMVIPEDFVFLCDVEYSSSEELSGYFARQIVNHVNFDTNVKQIDVSVYEGPGQMATWSEKL
jgi:6-pyruvoyltetrahydropterin/6-carboxytetrahydropterin synthase